MRSFFFIKWGNIHLFHVSMQELRNLFVERYSFDKTRERKRENFNCGRLYKKYTLPHIIKIVEQRISTIKYPSFTKINKLSKLCACRALLFIRYLIFLKKYDIIEWDAKIFRIIKKNKAKEPCSWTNIFEVNINDSFILKNSC